jgi:hypothetical protein
MEGGPNGMGLDPQKVTICIPQWQVKRYITLCLRSIAKHSRKYDLEVIVVDNGSRDESLEYLKSLAWVRLIERPEESNANWPTNVFTAWDAGIRVATSPLFLTLHSDVFVLADDWLDPMLEAMQSGPAVAAAGAWKLNLDNPLYAWSKRVTGYVEGQVKALIGRGRGAEWTQGHYPRDYCALYRRDAILNRQLRFLPFEGRKDGYGKGGGYCIASQLWDAGYETKMVGLRDMARRVIHVAHGTGGLVQHQAVTNWRKQRKLERRVNRILRQSWVQDLERDASLDRGPRRV